MAVKIPFNFQLEFEYGRVDQVSPLVRRVIARNPSRFTFHGTGTYIVGRGKVAIIDPGPLMDEHIEAVLRAVEGEQVTHQLITHTHHDHSPAARVIRERTGARTWAFGPHGSGRHLEGAVSEEGGDKDFVPDVQVRHGDVIEGDGWSFECVYTPGHTSNHMCYALREEKALFSGDHVMGWATSVISPPDGNMTAYLASLELLLQRDDEVFWPTHGNCIRDVKHYVRCFIDHRLERERQILEALRSYDRIQDMVPSMYTELDPPMYPAAARSVHAAMIRLIDTGKVVCEGEPGLSARYRLAAA